MLRGFKSHLLHFILNWLVSLETVVILDKLYCGVSKRSKGDVKRTSVSYFEGSNPSTTTAFLAQLVERKTFNLVVVGSSPTEGID